MLDQAKFLTGTNTKVHFFEESVTNQKHIKKLIPVQLLFCHSSHLTNKCYTRLKVITEANTEAHLFEHSVTKQKSFFTKLRQEHLLLATLITTLINVRLG